MKELKPVFAPWRLKVLETYKESKGCILCNILKAKDERESLVVDQSSASAYVVLNKFPYSNGHMMIVPKRHIGDWIDLSSDEMLEIHRLVKKSIRCLRVAVQAQGFNMGINLGVVAGAGIPDHVHWHIVPRWEGDHNFMPVLDDTRVISEYLLETYDKIYSAWQNEGD